MRPACLVLRSMYLSIPAVIYRYNNVDTDSSFRTLRNTLVQTAGSRRILILFVLCVGFCLCRGSWTHNQYRYASSMKSQSRHDSTGTGYAEFGCDFYVFVLQHGHPALAQFPLCVCCVFIVLQRRHPEHPRMISTDTACASCRRDEYIYHIYIIP